MNSALHKLHHLRLPLSLIFGMEMLKISYIWYKNSTEHENPNAENTRFIMSCPQKTVQMQPICIF